MSSSFANNPVQSISAFPVKTHPTKVTTANAAASATATLADSSSNTALETTIVFGSTSSLVPLPSSSSSSSSSALNTISSSFLISSSSSSFVSISTQSTTSATPSTTATSLAKTHNDSSKGLSRGALAGVIVGSVIGGGLLLGFLCLLFLRKKRNHQRISYHNSNEKEPLPQNFRNSYRRSVLSQTSSIRSHGYTPFTQPVTAVGNVNANIPIYSDATTDGSQTPIVDEDFWRNQPPLGTFTIMSSYTQTLDDELYIQPGDQVQVYTEYDDGWCLGVNLTRGGARGVFPQHCLDRKIDS